MAYFPNTSCDINAHFNAANIIIDLTFCEFPSSSRVASWKLIRARRRLGWLCVC